MFRSNGLVHGIQNNLWSLSEFIQYVLFKINNNKINNNNIVLSDLSFHTFSPEDINVMEMTILKAFDFNVLFTTSFSFILSYFVQLQLDQPTFIFSALVRKWL